MRRLLWLLLAALAIEAQAQPYWTCADVQGQKTVQDHPCEQALAPALTSAPAQSDAASVAAPRPFASSAAAAQASSPAEVISLLLRNALPPLLNVMLALAVIGLAKAM